MINCTDEIKKSLITRYSNGEGYVNLAEEYNLPHDKVADFLTQNGISLRNNLRKSLSEDQIKQVFELNEGGHNINAICERLDIHAYLVRRAFNLYNKVPKHYDNIRRRNLNLSLDQEKEICDLYVNQKMTQKELCDRYGLTQCPDIAAIVTKHGIKLRHPFELRRKFDKEKELEIIKEYQKEGSTLRGLCKQYKCDRCVIKGILLRNSIPLKPASECNIKKKYDVAKLIDLYKSGTSASKIALNMGLTVFTVCRCLRRNGLKIRESDTKAGGLKSKYLTSELEQKKVIDLYLKEKLSSSEIAKQFNVSRCVIERVLHQNNIQMRDWSSAGRIYDLDEDYLDRIDSNAKHLIMGILYSDGSNRNIGKFVMSLELNKEDLETVRFFKNSFNYGGQIRENPKKNSVAVQISSKKLSNRLIELGCVQNKSKVLVYPTWVEDKFFSHFLHGLFIGDGGIWLGKKAGLCLTGTPDVIKGVIENIKKNMDISIYIDKASPHTWTLGIANNLAVCKLCNFMFDGADFIMKRKFLAFRKIVENNQTPRYEEGKLVISISNRIIKESLLKFPTLNE